MVKLLTRTGRSTGRYLALATITMTLAACGGSSGDSTNNDVDGDGMQNAVDTDADGDNIPDVDDVFVDLNEDDLDDFSGLTEQQANFVPVTDQAVCGGEPGSDNESADPNWDNNCWVRQTNDIGEGQFANSLYTVGIQRVVYCSGFGDGDSYTDFADGRFGNLTEAALIEFQESSPNPISGDGEVGGQTWAKLQGAITRIAPGQFVENPDGISSSALDSYGFTSGRCENIPLFYQSVTQDPETQIAVEGGWRLAKNAPNSTESTLFSISDELGLIK